MINKCKTEKKNQVVFPTSIGSPTVILPGYFAGADAYQDLATSLQELGFPTVIVPLKRRDWLPTLGGRPMTPILNKLAQTIEQTINYYGVNRINLIGHSAGGWIARIYLGEEVYQIPGGALEKQGCWKGRLQVSTLVTLGTPHISQEKWTRRNIDFVNQTYPDAFYPDIRYICVAGQAVYGERRWGRWLTYNSYQLTCGQGNSWGDGITPTQAAHLKGAENITLEGVQHSPGSQDLWYGSPEVLPEWIKYLGS